MSTRSPSIRSRPARSTPGQQPAASQEMLVTPASSRARTAAALSAASSACQHRPARLCSVRALAIDPHHARHALCRDRRTPACSRARTPAHDLAALSTRACPTTSPPCTNVHAFAIDPLTPSTLYASTFSGWLRIAASSRARTAAANWQAANTGLPDNTIARRACHRSHDARTRSTPESSSGRAAASSRAPTAAAPGSAANAGLPDITDVKALAIDPLTPGTLYAGTNGGGSLQEHYCGRDLERGEHGLPLLDNGDNSIVSVLAAIPLRPARSTPGQVFCTLNDCFGGSVFKSTDGGDTWFTLNRACLNVGITVNALAIDPEMPSTLYAATGSFADKAAACFRLNSSPPRAWSARAPPPVAPTRR